jgi:hypothetical protein
MFVVNGSIAKRKMQLWSFKRYLVLQSNMVSPFAAHQQQLAFMSQQQALLMAALKAGNAPQITQGNSSLLNANSSNAPQGSLPFQNWPNLGYQNPGSIPTVAQNGAAKVNTQILLCSVSEYQSLVILFFCLAGW